MKKYVKLMGLVVLVMMLVTGCSLDQPGKSEGDGDNTKNKDIKIGLSISTLNNPFFVTLRDGAEKAAKDAGHHIVTADSQDDPSKQMSDIEDMLQQNIDILLVNPTDSEAVASAVQMANDEDIPVITVDRSSDGGEVVTHIASDNVKGGEMAAKFISKKLKDKGNVVELEGVSGASATRERGKGFHNVIDKKKDIKIIASQSGDFDRTKGLSVMENIIQSHKDIDAVFAQNDEMALGAYEALQAQGMDDVVVVGFDATDDAVKSVKEGDMAATIAQQPDLIGKQAVETAAKVLDGEKLDDFVPVELKLIK